LAFCETHLLIAHAQRLSLDQQKSRRQLQGKLISIIINNIIVVVISGGAEASASASVQHLLLGGNIISKHNKQTNK